MATIIKFRWTVDELDNALDLGFDEQKVYRSTTGIGGPYDEITGVGTRVPLVAGEHDYYYDDTSGDASYFYTMSLHNSITLAESAQSDPMQGDVEIAPLYLTLDLLRNKVGPRMVTQLFDDDGDGAIAGDDLEAANRIMAEAENEAASRVMRAYPSEDAIVLLARNDPAFVGHVAWIALEYATERKQAFLAADGKGRFWAQFERAIAYFEAIAKGRQRSLGEVAAGSNPQVNGAIQPTVESEAARFTFAPDTNNPTGHGSF